MILSSSIFCHFIIVGVVETACSLRRDPINVFLLFPRNRYFWKYFRWSCCILFSSAFSLRIIFPPKILLVLPDSLHSWRKIDLFSESTCVYVFFFLFSSFSLFWELCARFPRLFYPIVSLLLKYSVIHCPPSQVVQKASCSALYSLGVKIAGYNNLIYNYSEAWSACLMLSYGMLFKYYI